MNKMNHSKKLKAFSLNELLVVMVIIGILAAIAVPQFNSFTANAYESETGNWLRQIKLLQDKHRMMHFEYSMDVETIEFVAPKKEPEGTSVYTYEILEATASTFIAQATADKDYDGDGQFQVITINQEGKIETKVED
jgi:type IV pilus assembly protein PilE|tara:strand:- start:226 stop:636 length:411 start_codon:yes stop_codon:yes gene_type:complete